MHNIKIATMVKMKCNNLDDAITYYLCKEHKSKIVCFTNTSIKTVIIDLIMIHISQILGNFNTIIAECPKHAVLSTRKLHKSYSNKTKKQRNFPGLETLTG